MLGRKEEIPQLANQKARFPAMNPVGNVNGKAADLHCNFEEAVRFSSDLILDQGVRREWNAYIPASYDTTLSCVSLLNPLNLHQTVTVFCVFFHREA